jgi:glycosyltransferase involved in cell wall biosynthesis
VIPNGVDVIRFSPRDRIQAKLRFGLRPDNPLIVFGAVNPTVDARKGFEPFREAIGRLNGSGWSSRAAVMVFGAEGPAPSGANGMQFLGRVDDDEMLATLYSAADLTVAPSKQEAFGKTLIESFACATPVVAFRSGGPIDIVDHRHNGFLAEPFDAGALAEGIAWCLKAPEHASQLGRHGRAKAEATYDIHIVAARYRDLYRRILKGGRAAAA